MHAIVSIPGRRTTGRLLLPMALAGLVWGCGGDAEGPSSGGAPMEFLAGDTLVRVAGGPVHPGTAQLVLELSIGMVEGPPEYTLTRVPEILPLDDGSVLVHDYPASLRHFDAQGRFLRYFGRTGDGPGEFRQPGGLARMPDGRVLFGDARSGRINLYAPDGRVLDTWTLGSAYVTTGNSSGILTVDTAGTVLLRFTDRAARGDMHGGLRFVRFRSDGTLIDTIAPPVLPDLGDQGRAVKHWRRESGSETTVRLLVPYYPRSIWIYSPLGYFVTGRTDRYAVDLRAPSTDLPTRPEAGPPTWEEGRPLISIRRVVDPVPVSAEEARDQLAYLQARFDRMEGTMEGTIPPVPREKPLFNGLRIGLDGRIWVSVSTPSVEDAADKAEASQGDDEPVIRWWEPREYDVFEPDGRHVGRVAIPRGVWVLATLGDMVWAGTRDEFDVESVQRYRIDWPLR